MGTSPPPRLFGREDSCAPARAISTLFRPPSSWYSHCRGPASLPVEGNSVRSPTRFVALTAGLAVAVALLPVDVFAQGRGGRGGGGGGGRGGAVARSAPARPSGGGGGRVASGPSRGQLRFESLPVLSRRCLPGRLSRVQLPRVLLPRRVLLSRLLRLPPVLPRLRLLPALLRLWLRLRLAVLRHRLRHRLSGTGVPTPGAIPITGAATGAAATRAAATTPATTRAPRASR